MAVRVNPLRSGRGGYCVYNPMPDDRRAGESDDTMKSIFFAIHLHREADSKRSSSPSAIKTKRSFLLKNLVSDRSIFSIPGVHHLLQIC